MIFRLRKTAEIPPFGRAICGCAEDTRKSGRPVVLGGRMAFVQHREWPAFARCGGRSFSRARPVEMPATDFAFQRKCEIRTRWAVPTNFRPLHFSPALVTR